MASLLQGLGASLPDNFKLAVAMGGVPGWQTFRKFGMNEDVDVGTEDVWPAGGVRTLPSSAAVCAVVSSLAADDADPAGTGAWTVTIEGLDSDKLEISETVSLNGTTPVNTTKQFLRVNRAYAVTAGTGRVNAGNITISISGNTQAFIEAGEGQTHQTLYSVPSNKWLIVDLYTIIAGRIAGTDTVDVQGQIRLDGVDGANAAWRAISDIYMSEDVYQNSTSVTLIPPGTEVRAQAAVTGNNNTVSVIFGGYLVKTESITLNAYV